MVKGVDVGAWFGWALAGLQLFTGDHPPPRGPPSETRRVGVVLAMVRAWGNLAQAHRLTGSSPNTIREWLRIYGLFPWSQPPFWATPPLAVDGSE